MVEIVFGFAFIVLENLFIVAAAVLAFPKQDFAAVGKFFPVIVVLRTGVHGSVRVTVAKF